MISKHQLNRYIPVRGIVAKFTKAKRALDGLRNAMEDKKWQKAIDYMDKAERAMQ